MWIHSSWNSVFLHQQHEANVQQTKKLWEGGEEPWNLQVSSRVLDFSCILSPSKNSPRKKETSSCTQQIHTLNTMAERNIFATCALQGEQALWCSPWGQAPPLTYQFQAWSCCTPTALAEVTQAGFSEGTTDPSEFAGVVLRIWSYSTTLTTHLLPAGWDQ